MRIFRSKAAELFFGLLVVVAIAAVSGCAGDTSRLAVEGNVTMDGAPLPDGKISFTPLPGTSSPTGGATITGGKFQVAGAKGLRPGKFRVEIKALRATGKTIKDDVSGGEISQKQQFIPKRYNDESELTAEIKAGENKPLEFALVRN